MPALVGLFLLGGIWFSVFILKISKLKRKNLDLVKENSDLKIENRQLNQMLLKYDKSKEESEAKTQAD